MSGRKKPDFRLQRKGSKLLTQHYDLSQFIDMERVKERRRVPFKKHLKT